MRVGRGFYALIALKCSVVSSLCFLHVSVHRHRAAHDNIHKPFTLCSCCRVLILSAAVGCYFYATTRPLCASCRTISRSLGLSVHTRQSILCLECVLGKRKKALVLRWCAPGKSISQLFQNLQLLTGLKCLAWMDIDC